MNAGFPSNPFATRFTRPGAFEFRWNDLGDRDQLTATLMEHRAGLIVGPHGSGKSTLLCSLMQSLQNCFEEVTSLQLHESEDGGFASHWRHRREAFTQGCSALRRLRRGGLLLLDGAEQMSDRNLRRIVNLAIGRDQFVLATSHTAHGGLPILYRTQVSPPAIRSLTRELLAGQEAEVIRLVELELERRDLSNQSSLRDLWFDLYDVVQTNLLQRSTSPLR